MTQTTRIFGYGLAVVLLCVLTGCGDQAEPSSSAETEYADITWETSLAKAVEQAEATDRPIMMFFTGSDWCHWCMVLEEEVIHTRAFADWSAENVVLLKLDYPQRTELPEDIIEQNDKLQYQFRIEGFPTVVFASPDLKQIGRMGYLDGGPVNWTKEADDILN